MAESQPTHNSTHLNSPASDTGEARTQNFLRQIIERDLAAGSYAQRLWGGSPGDAAHHAAGIPDPARVRTRFPPEPNGYLHIGHAKSICINFGLARDYAGVCHMRFDDTNPEKEEQEFVEGILDAVHWLGFGWDAHFGGHHSTHLYQASDYFGFMYRAAERLIEADLAYVDEQSAQDMRANRGDFNTPGTPSPYRSRTPAENLTRFREMREGLLPDGAAVLRAKIDMASPNINLRDPAIYRIKHAQHHHTGNTWCIYPMYTYAHPIEDALEQITHSLCTLEFEDQRPFYDWLLARLIELGLLAAPAPRQYEFARLNLTYVVTSKRKLAQLVQEGHVSGWDDPRMPTLVGLRRRGYTPQAIQLFCERIGVTRDYSWIDYASLEAALRDDLDPQAPRAMAVLDPVRLVITDWDQHMGAGTLDACQAPVHPHHPERGHREFSCGRELWIERSDYEDRPPKGYNRLFPPQPAADGTFTPGNRVRLKYGHVVECTGAKRDASGVLLEVHATLVPDTKSATPGGNAIKVKGVITWVGVADGVAAEMRLYDRLFTEAQPDAAGRDYLACLNPQSLQVTHGYVEPSLAGVAADTRLQFERHGYFVTDRRDHQAGKPVYNRITGLRDSWGK